MGMTCSARMLFVIVLLLFLLLFLLLLLHQIHLHTSTKRNFYFSRRRSSTNEISIKAPCDRNKPIKVMPTWLPLPHNQSKWARMFRVCCVAGNGQESKILWFCCQKFYVEYSKNSHYSRSMLTFVIWSWPTAPPVDATHRNIASFIIVKKAHTPNKIITGPQKLRMPASFYTPPPPRWENLKNERGMWTM